MEKLKRYYVVYNKLNEQISQKFKTIIDAYIHTIEDYESSIEHTGIPTFNEFIGVEKYAPSVKYIILETNSNNGVSFDNVNIEKELVLPLTFSDMRTIINRDIKINKLL